MGNFSPRGVKKWLTVGGCFLLMFPTGVPWCWGNIGTYALSYIAVRGQTKTGVDTPWVMSIYLMCNFTGISLVGMVKKQKTKRLVLLLSVLMFSGGLCLTYQTVQMSVVMVTVSVGAMSGLGAGLVNGIALHYAGAWVDDDPGMVTAFVQSGYQFGNLFVHPLLSYYINPSNFLPSIEVNSIKLFPQPELLDRVPLGFVMFGASSFLLQIIGVSCLQEAPIEFSEESLLIEVGAASNIEPVHNTDTLNGFVPQNANTDKKTRDVIKIPFFYALCLVFVLFENAVAVLVNYYKDYGAVWIHDDLFLAFMGTPFVAGCGIGYNVWGIVSDRIGVKKTVICIFSGCSWLFLSMFFTPMLNRWLYMVNMVLLGFCLPPLFSILTVATRLYFGKTYFLTNLSVALLMTIATDLINPILLQALVRAGWFCVFFYASGVCFISLVITVVGLPAT